MISGRYRSGFTAAHRPGRANILWNVSGTSVTLSWPADHPGWRRLMQTSHLANGISLNPNDRMTVPASQTTNRMIRPLDLSLPGGF